MNAQDRWHSVTEGLPPKDEDVLVWCTNIAYADVARHADKVYGAWLDADDREVHDVSHWRPLPEPPYVFVATKEPR